VLKIERLLSNIIEISKQSEYNLSNYRESKMNTINNDHQNEADLKFIKGYDLGVGNNGRP
jgi:hypothetical protein